MLLIGRQQVPITTKAVKWLCSVKGKSGNVRMGTDLQPLRTGRVVGWKKYKD